MTIGPYTRPCATIVLTGVAALALAATAGAQEITIKYANVMGPAHDTSKAVDKFAELVAAKSGNKIKVQHFPGGQLGADKATYEAAQQGLLQIAGGSYANLVTITRAFEALHLPFIFDDRKQAHKALDSKKIRDAINTELAKVGMHWLMTFEYGFRDINTTSQKVTAPADLKGLKIRTSRSPTEIGGIKAFGGSAVTVDWPEVYNSLRFKVVDGAALPYATMVSAKQHEIMKHHLDLDWQYFAFVGMTSTKQWNAWSDDVKKVIEASAREAEQFHRKIYEAEDEKARQEILKTGGSEHKLSAQQRAEWIKLGRDYWKSSGVPMELVELIRSEVGK